jgi:hypothetical protein
LIIQQTPIFGWLPLFYSINSMAIHTSPHTAQGQGWEKRSCQFHEVFVNRA